MNKLPNIEGLQADPDAAVIPRRETIKSQSKSSSTMLGGLVVAIVLSTVISMAITWAGRDVILQTFGGKPAPNPVAQLSGSFREIKDQTAKLSEDFDSLRQAQSAMKSELADIAFKNDKTTIRIENLERFASSLESQIEQQKKQVVQAKKTQVKPQPKPQPIIPISLVSIRNMSGTPYVSVRDGLENSGLMMPGDVWHGWTLIDADPMNRTAMFMFNGSHQELRL
ncbi:MAG TPA: hypothetical protein VN030_05585 [Cellvibrio sp.]|nr:hypothetical protein [Cellvibrio sp.]